MSLTPSQLRLPLDKKHLLPDRATLQNHSPDNFEIICQKSKLAGARPVIFNHHVSVVTRATRWHLRTLPFLGREKHGGCVCSSHAPSLPSPAGLRRLPGASGHGGPGTPPPPREEPLTWRVISDLIFCMMAPPPPRVPSAAAQGAAARRSHVGRHLTLTAPARGSLGAVVRGRPARLQVPAARRAGRVPGLRLPEWVGCLSIGT